VVLGAALVFFCFPRKDAEQQLLRDYLAEDSHTPAVPARSPTEQ
jgi:hypothetical protein